MTQVSLDDVDQMATWQDFTLMLKADQNYNATNVSTDRELVWPLSGSYTFPDPDNLNQVVR